MSILIVVSLRLESAEHPLIRVENEGCVASGAKHSSPTEKKHERTLTRLKSRNYEKMTKNCIFENILCCRFLCNEFFWLSQRKWCRKTCSKRKSATWTPWSGSLLDSNAEIENHEIAFFGKFCCESCATKWRLRAERLIRNRKSALLRPRFRKSLALHPFWQPKSAEHLPSKD